MTDGPSLKISIDATGAKTGADQATSSFDKIKSKAKEIDAALDRTESTIEKVRGSLGRLASTISIVDGPLGGVASRVTAFGSLLGKVTPNLLGFTLATAAVGFVVTKSLQAFIPYEAAMAKLNAVLEVTGRSSQLTALQVDDLANSLAGFKNSRTDVIDTVAAISTFERIKTSDIKRVVETANDLSIVFGGTLQANALKVAKALEAPGQAFGILAREGIKFSKQEQETLALMQETGYLAEAQGIIWTELSHIHSVATKQQGTLAKSMDDLGDAMENAGIVISKNAGLTNLYKGSIDALTVSIEYLGKAAGVIGDAFSKVADVAIIAGARVGLLDQEVIKLAKDHFYGNTDATSVKKIGDAVKTDLADPIKKANPDLKNFTNNIDMLRKKAEMIKNGGLTDAAKKFKEELSKINEDKKAEVKGFGLESSDRELFKFEANIKKNQKAFDELGASGRKSANEIRESFVNLKQKEMTKPIDDYTRAAEFNFKKVNEIIVRSGDTFLDALTDPYREGETAAERWKGALTSILRDIAKEIIRTQIIAKAVSFTSSLFAPMFGGAAAPVKSFNGNVFNNGRIIPHAKGGVVSSFSSFPMAGGNIGTLAEGNKPEAILPLKRNSAGQLGVVAQGSRNSGGNVTINTVVNVDGSSGGSDIQNQELGKTIAKHVDQRIDQQLQKFMIRQLKTGGALNGAIA